MKNFTLRLTDNEAEALEIMAYCYGVSKNKFIQLLVSEAFENFMYFENPPEESITINFDFPALASLPDRLEENIAANIAATEVDPKAIKQILKVIDYALEKYDREKWEEITPTEAHHLEKMREDFIQELRSIDDR